MALAGLPLAATRAPRRATARGGRAAEERDARGEIRAGTGTLGRGTPWEWDALRGRLAGRETPGERDALGEIRVGRGTRGERDAIQVQDKCWGDHGGL
jgi:hypothetical protein